MADEFDGRAADRRDLATAETTGHLLRQDAGRPATAVQLPADHAALVGATDRAPPSLATKRCCRTARGPTGCWATTIGRGSRPVSALPRRASRRCCCSHCAARRRSTTATSWACATATSQPSSTRPRRPARRQEPRSRTHADALGRFAHRRLHGRPALAANGRRRCHDQC